MKNNPLLKEHTDIQYHLYQKYQVTGWLYDILDYPWERQYRLWRPQILADVQGDVLEAGVGTGQNLLHYPANVNVTGIDQSSTMLSFAKKKAFQVHYPITLFQADATHLSKCSSEYFDWYISTFMYCVMPNELQPKAIDEMARVLKPGGQFRILEIIYSQDPSRRRVQQIITPLVVKIYGARFDRQTLTYLKEHSNLSITETRFLKDDTYLMITGQKRSKT